MEEAGSKTLKFDEGGAPVGGVAVGEDLSVAEQDPVALPSGVATAEVTVPWPGEPNWGVTERVDVAREVTSQ